MIVVCEQGTIADPLLETENKHKNLSKASYPANSGKVEHRNEAIVSNNYTLCKVVSDFLRSPYHPSDVRSKECASRLLRCLSVVILELDALPVSP
jgi:hypothetical protein